MLSYRHSYHAGNFADVLKHLVQIAILDYLQFKDKPLVVHDTHGGAGLYEVASEHMQKTGEYQDGVGRLYGRQTGVEVIDRYLDLIAGFNDGGPLRRYPGSPAISAELLREQDRLQITELHNSDYPVLAALFEGDERIRVFHDDANRGLKSLLPAAHKRGLVLVDPSYELEGDEAHTLAGLVEGLRRFNTGCFAIWYPVIGRRRADAYAERLVALGTRALRLELNVRQPGSAHGMTGSGMVVINPPWGLDKKMETALPVLHKALAQGGGGWMVKGYGEE
ncbi:23S rRNA (adenine(2030)-N(6))-methyltransferase RlmJ [Alloalcanivorax mobilis]|uniref:23S rRNA (adenine(2030)-N(6))-methyltransferase RlmJ n=1 Tax=Alloalcanivorax mobilis TaxID=2019569 RepID=UPI000C783C99|nr:23S rRNA (adenine(2030)-N(6))-methyltransferase RlmJ [Alloalcanivorax mobilis]